MKHIICLLLLITVSKGISQNKEFSFWPGLKISYVESKRWKTDLYIQQRFNEINGIASNSFTDLNTTYKISENAKVALAYVFVLNTRSDNSISYRHQAYTEFVLSGSFRRFSYQYKPSFQIQYQDILSSEKGREATKFIRNKFQIEYNLSKKIDPYIYSEPRIELISNYITYNRFRIGAGIHINTGLYSQLDVYYLIQSRFYDVIPNQVYVLGLNYNYKIFNR